MQCSYRLAKTSTHDNRCHKENVSQKAFCIQAMHSTAWEMMKIKYMPSYSWRKFYKNFKTFNLLQILLAIMWRIWNFLLLDLTESTLKPRFTHYILVRQFFSVVLHSLPYINNTFSSIFTAYTADKYTLHVDNDFYINFDKLEISYTPLAYIESFSASSLYLL